AAGARHERARLTARNLRAAVLGELDLGEALAALGEPQLLGLGELTGLRGVERRGAELDLDLRPLPATGLLGQLALRLDLDLDAALEDPRLAVADDLQRDLLLALGNGVGRRGGGEAGAEREGKQGNQQPGHPDQD